MPGSAVVLREKEHRALSEVLAVHFARKVRETTGMYVCHELGLPIHGVLPAPLQSAPTAFL